MKIVPILFCSLLTYSYLCTVATKLTRGWRAALCDMNDIAEELSRLAALEGYEFVKQLKTVTESKVFKALATDPFIYTVGGNQSDDYVPLLNAARKGVSHGYRVFILPNPKDIRTADFIFERRGVYKMFDLKTISGKNSVDNRLVESIGQTNRVLLNITTVFNPSILARSIKRYFNQNPTAREVLIFKGKKQISVTKKSLDDSEFFKSFIQRYNK